MTLPAYLIDLTVVAPDRRPFHLWLPLFLLWPLLLVLAVLSLVLTILADIVLWAMGSTYHSYTLLLLGCFKLFADVRGTTVRVHTTDTNIDLTIV